MAFRPSNHGRDKAYPSQIAAERPMCATRIHCEEDLDVHNASLRGGEHEMHTEERCDLFNRQLRAGHAYRNEEDEREE